MASIELNKLFALHGKCAVVTGAGGFLGRHFSRSLASAGADVVLVEKNAADLAELEKELISTSPGKVFSLGCDLGNADEIRDLLPPIIEQFKPSILINNAASKGPDINRFFDPPATFSPEIWREIMAVNLDAMFWMAQLVADSLIVRKQSGSIVQISSIYGVVAPDQRIYEGSEYLGRPINTPAIYSASKGGVIALTRYLAAYWGANGIRVNTISPGGMFSGQNDTFLKNYSERVPLGRMGNPEELIGGLLYLASDASSYVTGQNLVVDGGLSAW